MVTQMNLGMESYLGAVFDVVVKEKGIECKVLVEIIEVSILKVV